MLSIRLVTDYPGLYISINAQFIQITSTSRATALMETYDPDSFQHGWNSRQSYLHTFTYFVPYSKYFYYYCTYHVKCHWLTVTLNLFVIFSDYQIKHISHSLIYHLLHFHS